MCVGFGTTTRVTIPGCSSHTWLVLAEAVPICGAGSVDLRVNPLLLRGSLASCARCSSSSHSALARVGVTGSRVCGTNPLKPQSFLFLPEIMGCNFRCFQNYICTLDFYRTSHPAPTPACMSSSREGVGGLEHEIAPKTYK